MHEKLHSDSAILIYNNGDPTIFNPIAKAVLDTFQELLRRGHIDEPTSHKTHLSIGRRPVEIVSNLLGDFSSADTRVVGGKPHELLISPEGIFESRTGDKP